MHSILLAIKKGNFDDDAARTKWWNTLKIVEDAAKRNPRVQELSVGCWLIPLDTGLPFLGRGIAALETHNLSYTILYFEKPPDAHTQQAHSL